MTSYIEEGVAFEAKKRANLDVASMSTEEDVTLIIVDTISLNVCSSVCCASNDPILFQHLF